MRHVRLILRLLEEGVIDGLRIDRPGRAGRPTRVTCGGCANVARRRMWVEKILATAPSACRADWPVTGTVGYEFLSDACELFVDPAGRGGRLPSSGGTGLSGGARRDSACGRWPPSASRRRATFAPEVERLSRLTPDLRPRSAGRRRLNVTVYRTYIDPAAGSVADDDSSRSQPLRLAVSELLLGQAPAVPSSHTLSADDPGDHGQGRRGHRLLSLLSGCLPSTMSAGRRPGRFGVRSTSSMPVQRRTHAAVHPEALADHHDPRRKALVDARASDRALSQIPDRWVLAVRRWLELSERHGSEIDGRTAPDLAERYFIFQTLVGVWPIEPERLDGYLREGTARGKTRRPTGCSRTPPTSRPVKDFARGSWTTSGSRWTSSHSSTSSRRWRCGRPWDSCCSSSPVRAYPIPTRATSSSSAHWWTRTTAGRSTGNCAVNAWTISSVAGAPETTSGITSCG